MQVDLVTETDKACEDLIFSHLKQLYPTHKVNTYPITHFMHQEKLNLVLKMCCFYLLIISELVPTLS